MSPFDKLQELRESLIETYVQMLDIVTENPEVLKEHDWGPESCDG